MSSIFFTIVWITGATYLWKSPISLYLVKYTQSRFLRKTTLASAVMLAEKNTSFCICCLFAKMKQNSGHAQEKKSMTE